jgi:cell division protein FtsL
MPVKNLLLTAIKKDIISVSIRRKVHMSGLEQSFYILGIIFMAVMLVLIGLLLISVVVIRSKVNRIHQNIDEKINSLTDIAEKGGELAAIATGVVAKKAKKALNKKK